MTTSALLASSRKMLLVLKEHMAVLEAAHQKKIDEYVNIPSQNQHYFCISDDNGVIQLFQDAAFVVEQILITGQGDQIIENYQFSVEDGGASRVLTLASRPRDIGWNSATQPIVDSPFVPQEVLVPLAGPATAMNLNPNNDYWVDLPVEWLLPRGGVVRFTMDIRPALSFTPLVGDGVYKFPTMTLSGYKVY